MMSGGEQKHRESDRESFIIYAPNTKDHPKKRIVISYITILIIQEMRKRGIISSTSHATKGGASLQSSQKADSEHEAAHQNLGELYINTVPAWKLLNNNAELQSTLKYCFAVVSNIHKTYNWADDLVEKHARDRFCELANNVIEHDMSNVDILTNVFSIFTNACSDAQKKEIDQMTAGKVPTPKKYEKDGATRTIKWVDGCLDEYLRAAEELKEKICVIASKKLDYWMAEIRNKGLTPRSIKN